MIAVIWPDHTKRQVGRNRERASYLPSVVCFSMKFWREIVFCILSSWNKIDRLENSNLSLTGVLSITHGWSIIYRNIDQYTFALSISVTSCLVTVLWMEGTGRDDASHKFLQGQIHEPRTSSHVSQMQYNTIHKYQSVIRIISDTPNFVRYFKQIRDNIRFWEWLISEDLVFNSNWIIKRQRSKSMTFNEYNTYSGSAYVGPTCHPF